LYKRDPKRPQPLKENDNTHRANKSAENLFFTHLVSPPLAILHLLNGISFIHDPDHILDRPYPICDAAAS
jgi:hypothetical protein